MCQYTHVVPKNSSKKNINLKISEVEVLFHKFRQLRYDVYDFAVFLN